jgi:hypothetical protein
VAADGTVNFYYDSHTWPNNLASFEPQVYEVNAPAADAQAIFQKMQNKSHTWQGLVFQSTSSSNRWRMRNPAYMTARALRGSEATAMERFLRLRAAGETKKYLSYFREENQLMWSFEEALRKRTTDLYNAYFNEPASQLAKLHQSLDALVLKAYGWKDSEDILSNLLDLNLELADREAAGENVVAPWAPS